MWMYAYTIQNNVVLIVQGVAKDVAPSPGVMFMVHSRELQYICSRSHLFCEIIFYRFCDVFSIDNFHIFSVKNHNIRK